MTVIYGAGGHGRDIAAWTGWRLVDDDPARAARPITPEPFVIGVNDSRKRLDLAGKLLLRGWDTPEVATSVATVIGPGVRAQPGTVISPFVHLGCDVVLGPHTHLNSGVFATRAEIGAFVTIGPGTRVCGDVTIGDRCQIGAGVTIANLTSICDDVTLGAGAVVVKDITEPGTYVGVPCGRI